MVVDFETSKVLGSYCYYLTRCNGCTRVRRSPMVNGVVKADRKEFIPPDLIPETLLRSYNMLLAGSLPAVA